MDKMSKIKNRIQDLKISIETREKLWDQNKDLYSSHERGFKLGKLFALKNQLEFLESLI